MFSFTVKKTTPEKYLNKFHFDTQDCDTFSVTDSRGKRSFLAAFSDRMFSLKGTLMLVLHVFQTPSETRELTAVPD